MSALTKLRTTASSRPLGAESAGVIVCGGAWRGLLREVCASAVGTTFDASISYDLSEHSYIQLTVDNIFDKDPPLVLGSSSNVDLFNHDLVGRFITLGLTYRF